MDTSYGETNFTDLTEEKRVHDVVVKSLAITKHFVTVPRTVVIKTLLTSSLNLSYLSCLLLSLSIKVSP